MPTQSFRGIGMSRARADSGSFAHRAVPVRRPVKVAVPPAEGPCVPTDRLFDLGKPVCGGEREADVELPPACVSAGTYGVRPVRDNRGVSSQAGAGGSRRNRKGLEMWMWAVISVVVVAVVLVAKWMDRSRGSQGASRSLDLPGIKDGRPSHIDTNDGFNGM